MGLFGFGNRDQAFWRWFERHSDSLLHFEDDQQRLLGELSRELGKVDAGLVFEFSTVSQGRREFVISADGILDRFPIVERLVSAAPEMHGWRVLAFRQPGDASLSIQFGDMRLGPDDIWFDIVPTGDKVEVLFCVRGLTSDNQRDYAGAVFVLMDNAVGEYVATTRIGGIDWRALPDDPAAANLRPFGDLPKALAAS